MCSVILVVVCSLRELVRLGRATLLLVSNTQIGRLTSYCLANAHDKTDADPTN